MESKTNRFRKGKKTGPLFDGAVTLVSPLRRQRFLFGSVAGACHHSHPNLNTLPDLCPTSAYHSHSQSRPLPWFYQSLCLRIHIYLLLLLPGEHAVRATRLVPVQWALPAAR